MSDLIPNILVLETDRDIITLLSIAPDKLFEIDRVPRPSNAPIPTEAPMVLWSQKIYRMEFFFAPQITVANAKKQSNRLRKLISTFKCKTSGRTKRPAITQIEIDRNTMARWHEVLEKNENGLWETVHRHTDNIYKKNRKDD